MKSAAVPFNSQRGMSVPARVKSLHYFDRVSAGLLPCRHGDSAGVSTLPLLATGIGLARELLVPRPPAGCTESSSTTSGSGTPVRSVRMSRITSGSPATEPARDALIDAIGRIPANYAWPELEPGPGHTLRRFATNLRQILSPLNE